MTIGLSIFTLVASSHSACVSGSAISNSDFKIREIYDYTNEVCLVYDIA